MSVSQTRAVCADNDLLSCSGSLTDSQPPKIGEFTVNPQENLPDSHQGPGLLLLALNQVLSAPALPDAEMLHKKSPGVEKTSKIESSLRSNTILSPKPQH